MAKNRAPQWATVREVADHFRVSERTVQHWCSNGRIPSVRPGGQWRIPRWVIASDVLQQPAA